MGVSQHPPAIRNIVLALVVPAQENGPSSEVFYEKEIMAMTMRIFVGILLLAHQALAQKSSFTEPGWDLSGDDTKVVSYLGRQAIQMRSGAAVREDIRFEDGTIEFDVASVGLRSFVYLLFRMQPNGEHEELYFRPHKSTLPDFIQYSPVYRGESHWQLYHGEGYTAAATMPAHEWVHIRVVLSGAQAAVFVGDSEEPQLIVPLARKPAPGYIALRSFFPAGSELAGPVTHFSNLVLRPGEVSFNFREPPTKKVPPGVVMEWDVSEPFASPEAAVETISKPERWKRVAAEPSGLVVLLKHLSRPEGIRRSSVLAKLDLRADRARTVPLELGYSDEVSVFVNGRLLFSADDSYSFNFPRRQGLIGLGQATFHLPLEQGDNELIIAVTDTFGGWGWIGRLHEATGVELVQK